MINPGAVLQYQAQAVDTITQNPQDVLTAVAQVLASQGIAVQANSISTPSLFSQAQTLLLESFSIPFTANLTVQVSVNGGGYNSQDDVKSIIDNAFWQVTGSLPTSSSIPNVVSNPGGAAGATGEASQIPFSGSDASSSIGDMFSDFFNNLSTGSTFALIAVLVVVVVIIALVISPGSAAGVVRSFR